MELILTYAVVDRVVSASFSDLRTHLIPKWDVVPVFLAGVVLHGVQGGWMGAVSSVFAAIAFLSFAMMLAALPTIILGPSARKKFGGGDAKLILACGAFYGMDYLWVLLVSYSLITSIFDLCSFIGGLKSKNPVSVVKETVDEFKAELYGGGKKEIRAYAPFITIPFIVAIIIKYHMQYGF